MNLEVDGKAVPCFLAAGRSGHTADPGARCPFCGRPAGMHRGVDLAGDRFFPMRAVICEPAPPPKCTTCGDKRWLGTGYVLACGVCKPEGLP